MGVVPGAGSRTEAQPDADLLGETTRAEVFRHVLTAGPISRAGLAERLGLSPSSITRLLPALIDADYVRERLDAPVGPGRPHRLLSVNPERHVVIGVKIAPGYVVGVVTDLGMRVLTSAEYVLDGCTPSTALAAAGRLARGLLGRVPDGFGPALAVGVGLSGHVDGASGMCRYSGLLGWRDIDVAGPLRATTGLPVFVANDVNALVVAQRWFGAGREAETFAVVTTGPGVGCGLLVAGSLFTGSSGSAGEFGHIPIDPAGPECTCGRRGCLEALASDRAVLGRLARAGVHCPDITAAASLARAEPGRDDPGSANSRAARAAFAAAGDALGRGLATLCNLINPELVILAGEGVRFQDLTRPAIDDALAHHAFSTAAADCTVLVDPVDDDMWTRGAACLALQAGIRAPQL